MTVTPNRATPTHPRRRLRLLATVVGLVVLAAPLTLTGCGTSGSPSPSVAAGAEDAAGAASTDAAPSGDDAAHVARPTHEGVEVHAEADVESAVVSTLALTTPLGSPTTLLVLDRSADDGGWVLVALPTRPNGSQGWVDDAELTEQVDDFAVTVSLSEHVLRVTRDGQVAVETPVAVGADATPTPVGRFYVTDVVDTGKPGGAYGPFALGLSAHSDVLDQFAGGDGQIGIHGTNEPTSIGSSVSHGCVRVPNEVITALAANLPLGTPVTITV